MKILVSLVLLLGNHVAFSQAINRSDIIALSKNLISKPLSTFTDSIECGENGFADKKIVDMISCRNFQVLPSAKNPFQINAIDFPSVVLCTDSLKVITDIMLLKGSIASGVSIKQIKNDFFSVVDYFNTLFKKKGMQKKYYKEEFYVTIGYEWEAEGLHILVQKTERRKKWENKKVSLLNIFISKGF